jgi:hypothetical protein
MWQMSLNEVLYIVASSKFCIKTNINWKFYIKFALLDFVLATEQLLKQKLI